MESSRDQGHGAAGGGRGSTGGLRSALVFALFVLLAPGARCVADVVTIDSSNIDRYRALLPDPVARRVERGQYYFKLVDVDPKKFRANYTDRFWQASKQNAGRFRVDETTGGLIDGKTGTIPRAVYGFPFPEVRQDDPQAAVKIVHNYRVRAFQGEGNVHTFDLSDVELDGDLLRRVKIFLSHKYYVGVDGAPPSELPDNTEWRQLGAALEPQDVEGVGVLTWRFNDWTTWDHVWAYVPSIRRVRRMRTSIRSERVPGFEVYADDADCYDGKVTYFTWKLAGAGEIIGPVGGETPYAHTMKREGAAIWSLDLPYNNAVYETPGAKGAGWLTLRNVFVRRPVWVVEGVPRDPYYEAGRAVLYVDRELYNAYYKISYTRAGEQYQTNFCGSAWGKSPDGKFGSPTPVLMTGVNEKEDRGTPTGRYTRVTFDRALGTDAFTPEHLARLSGAE